MTTIENYEPGEPDLPEFPEKVDFMIAAYGWLKNIHSEVEEALAELELYIPEEKREGALDRAKARADFMLYNTRFAPPKFPRGAEHGMRSVSENPE